MLSKRVFFVNSRNKSIGETNNFSYQFTLPVNHKFTHVCILQASIPKSWYVIQNMYNFFTLIEAGKHKTIFIPPSNYNRLSLAKTVAQILTERSDSGFKYDVTFPTSSSEPDAGKYRFTVTDQFSEVPGANIHFEFFEPHVSDMFERLGFSPGRHSFVSGALMSQNVTKVQSEEIVQIASNVCGESGNNILLEVYANNTPSFGTIVWECQDPKAYSRQLVDKTSNTFHFSLQDQYGHLLDLNGLNYCFTILFYEAGLTSPDPP